MKIAFNPSTVAALTTPPNNKDITFDLRGRNIFARGVKFCGTDTWRDIKINNVSIGSNTLDLRNGSNTTLTNTNGVVTINSTWRPVVDNLTSDSTTSSLSANQGRVLKALIDGKSNSGHTHDDRYVKKSGDTMRGALNFANGTWNLVGDDSYMGDCNISGHFGIKAANTTYPGISFFNNTNAHLGNLTAYSSNIKYGAYSLQFLDNGNTSVSASTWMNPFSTYNASAIADGQAVCVWGQSSYLGNLANDTGDMSLWLRRVNANVVTLNMVLDGEYYANGNQRLAHVSEIPNSLKNPYALTISLNGTSQGPYDGSAAKNINITPSSIGAATSDHNHDGRYVYNYGGTQMDGASINKNALGMTTNSGITGDWWHILQAAWNGEYRWNSQIAFPTQNRNGMYYRSGLDDNTAWGAWVKLLDVNNYSSTLDSRYYTESEVDSLLDAKLNRQNLSYGTWNPRGYNLAADYSYNGGDLSISESGGKIHVSVDGYFWQNEGQYRVLDTSDVAGLKNNLTVHQYLSNTDTTWWPLIWGGSPHNNTSDSTGTVYKSYDKLSWQTSSQTLYATNIQTENIKHLSIGGGIYWNPYVESTTDGTDAASITLVRQGVAGGTTLVLSQMNDTNDTIQFKTNGSAKLYHNSYPILTTQNTYVSNNKGYINGTEITQVNNADTVDNYHETAFPRLVGIKGNTWNWNDVIRAGYYKIQSGTITNHPSGIYPFGMAEVITTENHNDGENRELQIYYPHSQTNNIAIWLRMHNSSTQGNGWGSWVGVPNINGNIASATKLQTPRTIWGQSFNGTADVDNTLRIRQTTGNYCEGIRIQNGDNTWATIILGATGDSGTNANAWSIHRKSDNNFAISRNSSDGVNGLVMTSIGMGLGTTAPTQRLDVHGNIIATGQLFLPTNGNYNAILMGDDCWMGDCNIGDVIGLSGRNNANAGGIKFGKGGMYIGYNGSSHYSSGTSLWSNFNADLLDGYHASAFVKMKQFRFNQYNQGTWTKILTITINSTTDLQPVIAFSWIPSECSRTIWADFSINWRSNSPIFYAIWKGMDSRTLKVVNSSGAIWDVWVSGSKNSWDPFGEIQVTYTHNITSYNGGSLGYSDTDPGGTICITGGQVNYANSAGSATKVIVNQHTANDTNYPLVWSNQNNTNNATENQLYKSWSDLYYNPKNKRLTVGGSIYAAHFYESSDKTLKKNIKSILSSTNIPKIREFDWKDTGEHSYGFIAQELEEQGYGCLVSEANGKKTVNYTATLALAVAKLQNLINIQNKKISNLTKELKALKYGRKKNS